MVFKLNKRGDIYIWAITIISILLVAFFWLFGYYVFEYVYEIFFNVTRDSNLDTTGMEETHNVLTILWNYLPIIMIISLFMSAIIYVLRRHSSF